MSGAGEAPGDAAVDQRYQDAVDVLIDLLDPTRQTAFWRYVDGEIDAETYRNEIR